MMRKQIFAAAFAATLAAGVVAVATAQTPAPMATNDAQSLRPASSFDRIADPSARSAALFEEAGKVLTHPRCVNCHPRGDRPLQTDLMRLHQPLVVRGADGHGVAALQCSTCHHKENFDPARVPGHADWHLAPVSMAWERMSLRQICEQLKDRDRNGGKDLAAIVKHSAEDGLVGWGWNPGPGRTPAPGTQAEFGALMKAWAETGAHCPA